MAIALVAHTGAGSGVPGDSFNVTTPAIDTTGANFIVVALGVFSSFVPFPIDSKGNVYTPLALHSSTLGGFIKLWYCASPVVGTGHTFSSLNSSTVFPSICAAAFSGVAASSPFDQQNGLSTSGSSATMQPGSLTPSANNYLVVTGVVTSAAGASSINSGFTITDNIAFLNLYNYGVALAYLIQTSATAENPTWTGTGLQAAAIASFKVSSTPPPPASPLPPGITLDTSTGLLSGTPTMAGNYPYTITVTDSLGLTATASCDILVSAPTPPPTDCIPIPVPSYTPPLALLNEPVEQVGT